MDVLAVETAARCKLCQHEKRPEIDRILLARSMHLKDEAGRPYNLARVLEVLAEMGVHYPTADNVKNHWKKHCRKVSSEEAAADGDFAAARREEAIRILDRIAPDRADRSLTPDEVVELQRALYVWELEARIEAGKDLGLTHDHAIKGVAESTKRKHDERVGTLLETLVVATGKALDSASRRALPAGEEVDVVDAEVVGEE